MADRESQVWVRLAREDDLDMVLHLVTLMHDEDPPMLDPEGPPYGNILSEILSTRGRYLLVGGCGGESIAGTADMIVVPNLSRHGRSWAVVENVVVDPRYRRRGIARALMGELIAQAQRDGCYKLELVSAARRKEAHALYESLGFDAAVRGFRRYLEVLTPR